ncbi:hypothetical protein U8C40_29255 (plasmid) [Sinorhizobium medicae]|uniref:hypothetical protein n=1 Tax=Sinorhizobium medicae TaxID=110321 RepID=UPI002B1BE2FA|nr:hypothetical protein [Sinorhizobium medicae]WQO48656.1 hypothetical protein U8C42_28705 [Sinorhizobium medicae]WQO68904.1 hypothetical protein U8C40_29255 [Sinorhizobium medicae]
MWKRGIDRNVTEGDRPFSAPTKSVIDPDHQRVEARLRNEMEHDLSRLIFHRNRGGIIDTLKSREDVNFPVPATECDSVVVVVVGLKLLCADFQLLPTQKGTL